MFFWAQKRERKGLFARRFTPSGQVTTVPTEGNRRAGDIRFVPGLGIRWTIEAPLGHRILVELHDLAGRRLATERVQPSGQSANVVFANTADLPSGVYFARASTGTGIRHARVAVAR